jgi:hypothetical protein
MEAQYQAQRNHARALPTEANRSIVSMWRLFLIFVVIGLIGSVFGARLQ